MRRDPLRDRVVSIAVHLQLHRLPAPERQCVRAEHAGEVQRFRILQGEPKGWRHTSPGGTPVISRFCGNCGSRLYGERDGRLETVSLRAGTLDDTSWLVPVAHFLCAAPSRGCDRRPVRHVSKPSRTAGEACCQRGVPAGPTPPIDCPRALFILPPGQPARPRFIAQESSRSMEPFEAVRNYRWFGRLFWSSRFRKKRRAEFGAWMTSWPAGSRGSTCF